MKPCTYCGVEMRFVLLDEVDGKKVWSPPMEAVSRVVKRGRVKTFEYPRLTVSEVFVAHECQGLLAEREAKRLTEQFQHAMRRDRARVTEEAWVVALKVACPKCGVFAEHRCINMSDRRNNSHPFRTVAHPHQERLPAGWPDV